MKVQKPQGRALTAVLVVLVLLIATAGGTYWIATAGHGIGEIDNEEIALLKVAKGLIAVDPRQNFDPLANQRSEENVDWVGLAVEKRTQVAILTSDSLFDNALSDVNSPLRQTEWAKQFEAGTPTTSASTTDGFDIRSARRWLVKHFIARPIKDSKLIVVYIDGPQGDAKTIIECVVEHHLQEQRSISSQRMVDRSTTLHNLRFKLENRLKELLDQRSASLTRLLVVGDGHERTTATIVELKLWIGKKVDAAIALGNAQASLASLQSAVDAKSNLSTQPSSDASFSKQDSLRDLQAAKYQVDSTQAALERITKQIEALTQTATEEAIAMADQDAIKKEIDEVSGQLGDLTKQTDQLASSANYTQVAWARKPEKPDAGDK